MKRIAIAMLLGVVLIVAMAMPVLAGPVFQVKGTEDVTGWTVFNPATGGVITLDGTVDWRVQWVLSKKSSEIHYTFHLQGHLTGVDSVFGELYQIAVNGSENLNSSNEEGKYIFIARAVAPGPGDNLFFKFHVHWTQGNLVFAKITAEIR